MNGISQDKALSKVTPLALRAYLEGRGWRKVEPYGDIGDVYAFDDASPEIIVPMSSRFADYNVRMGQVVRILASAEDRAQEAVLRDLLLSDFNLLRVRLPDVNDDGSMPLDTAADVIQHSRDMLLAAACSAINPKHAFKTDKPKKARDYMKTVRLGQTEPGKFAIDILSPSPAALVPETDLESAREPFTQTVMDKLVSGLGATRKAVDLAILDSSAKAFKDGVQSGVSVNLCDAVRGMIGNEIDGWVHISVSWSLTSLHPRERFSVRFNQSDAPMLREAARVLRKQGERSRNLVVS